MPTTYDPKIMEEHSRNMDQSAKITAVLYSGAGVVVGFALGAGLFHVGLLKVISTLAAGAVGGYTGYRYGKVRTTELRSQAQTSLCLAEIERNTRRV
jgi:hypothetical protein